MFSLENLDRGLEQELSIFGPAINTKASKSFPWNLARTLTFVKACSQKASIPIHVNMGMGVGAVTMTDNPPIDTLSRASTAMVEICRLDGLQVGAGDPFGMAISHAIASGMGGMRGAGDLAARMQMTRGMKTDQAKKYVADKLQVGVSDLTDPVLMQELRDELQIGIIHPMPGCAKGIEAKMRIAQLLDIEINFVERFQKKIHV